MLASVAVANVGTLTADLSRLLIEYGVGDPAVHHMSTLIKQLLLDIDSAENVHKGSIEYTLALATAALLIDTFDSSTFRFERSSSAAGIGLENFKSLHRRPNLTIFERLADGAAIAIVNKCEKDLNAGNVAAAAASLAEWMRTTRSTLPNCSANEWMLHTAVNSVAIAHASSTRALALKVTSAVKQASFHVDTPDSITLLVEAPDVATIMATPHIHSAGKHVLVTGPDTANQHGFLVPATGTLTAYKQDELASAVLAELDTNPLPFELSSVRGNRVSAVLYETADEDYIVLAIYHFKNPKHADWPEQCAHLLEMYHTVLTKLGNGANVIMAGDSNLPTVEDANRMSGYLSSLYGLTAGNTTPSFFTSKSCSFTETSARGRALPASIGQASKCQDNTKDLAAADNSIGPYDSSAKIGFAFDARQLSLSRHTMAVGNQTNATPSPAYHLDHRWVLATFQLHPQYTLLRIARIATRLVTILFVLLLVGSILTSHL